MYIKEWDSKYISESLTLLNEVKFIINLKTMLTYVFWLDGRLTRIVCWWVEGTEVL